MNASVFEPIARTVLYEGHVLYPYRPSALKNQHAFTFGTLHPPSVAGERSRAGFAVLIESATAPAPELRLCFLHDGVERGIAAHAPGTLHGESSGVRYRLEAGLIALRDGVWKLEVDVANTTPGDGTPAHRMASAHVRAAIEAGSGRFVSLQDPPPGLAAAAAQCRMDGLYPVLIGEAGERRYLLAAPIILEDHPRIAPQSKGDFCDAAEMDELLALRVLTLTEDEKNEIRAAGGEARAILNRCEALPDVTGLHGGVSRVCWEAQPPESARTASGSVLRVGDRVRLHPSGQRRRADLFDQILEGRIARIQAIEQDLEGAIQLAVVAEDDPGRDLGERKQTGHRFFYSPSEVEPLCDAS